MVVESEGETGKRQAGQGTELRGFVSWEKEAKQLCALPHCLARAL